VYPKLFLSDPDPNPTFDWLMKVTDPGNYGIYQLCDAGYRCLSLRLLLGFMLDMCSVMYSRLILLDPYPAPTSC
jgi:hypothetical protein